MTGPILDAQIVAAHAAVRDGGTDGRVHRLVELARLHVARYRVREEIGDPDAAADLDEAVRALTQAYVATAPGGAGRSRLASSLGRVQMVRYLSPGGQTTDREQAIQLFEESLADPDLPPGDLEVGRLASGTLSMLGLYPRGLFPKGTAMPDFGEVGAALARLRDPDGAARVELDRAVNHFQHLVDHEPVHPELHGHATTMLASALLLRQISGSGTTVSLPVIIALLARAVSELPAGTPGRMEIDGLRAWLVSDTLLLPAPAGQVEQAQRELVPIIDSLPEGNLLRPALLRQLARLTAAQLSQPSAADELTSLVSRALREMPADYPTRADTEGMLAAAHLVRAVEEPTGERVEHVVELARAALAGAHDDAPALGTDHFLMGMALTVRGRWSGDQENIRTAAGHLREALSLLPSSHPLAPTVLGMLGALLNDRHLLYGVLEDADAARFYLARASEVLTAQVGTSAGTEPDLSLLRGLRGISAAALGIRTADPPRLAEGIEDLAAALAALPPGYPWRSRIEAALALAYLAQGLGSGDVATIRTGLRVIEVAVAPTGADRANRPTLLALAGLAALLTAALDGTPPAGDRAIELLSEAVGLTVLGPDQRGVLRGALGSAYLLRSRQGGGRRDLDAAVEWLGQAGEVLSAGPGGGVLDAILLRQRAQAYRERADPAVDDLAAAVRTGLLALRRYGVDVLLQTDSGHAVTAARGAADEACRIAAWCLADERLDEAVEAVELGRGLVLHAATVGARVPELLRLAHREDLAREWEERPPVAPTLSWLSGSVPAHPLVRGLAEELLGQAPSDLRVRVVAALAETVHLRRLVAAPAIDEITDGLRAVGVDALVYLIPAASPDDPGQLLVVADGQVRAVPAAQLLDQPGGPLARYLDAYRARMGDRRTDGAEEQWAAALEDLCDWAWPAAIGPLLEHLPPPEHGRPACVVLVPSGVLACVPWHAARTVRAARHHYACADLVISYAASARQLLDVAGRTVLPVGRSPVFVANPLGDQPNATFEALALRRTFYLDSVGLGELGDPADGPGTPDEVLSYLPGPTGDGASLVHLACHGYLGARPDESCLQLVDGLSGDRAPLSVGRILRQAYGRPADAPGGLVVLSACTSDLSAREYDEALTLASTFLAAGAAATVGSRWEVSDRLVPPLMFMFHHYLNEEGMPPAAALRAAQLWMLDPDRQHPPTLPALFAGDLRLVDLGHPAHWAAFNHQGR